MGRGWRWLFYLGAAGATAPVVGLAAEVRPAWIASLVGSLEAFPPAAVEAVCYLLIAASICVTCAVIAWPWASWRFSRALKRGRRQGSARWRQVEIGTCCNGRASILRAKPMGTAVVFLAFLALVGLFAGAFAARDHFLSPDVAVSRWVRYALEPLLLATLARASFGLAAHLVLSRLCTSGPSALGRWLGEPLETHTWLVTPLPGHDQALKERARDQLRAARDRDDDRGPLPPEDRGTRPPRFAEDEDEDDPIGDVPPRLDRLLDEG